MISFSFPDYICDLDSSFSNVGFYEGLTSLILIPVKILF